MKEQRWQEINIKKYDMEYIINNFGNQYDQMCKDISRSDITYKKNIKINNLDILMEIINKNLYLKLDKEIIYIILSQTILSLPLKDIYDKLEDKEHHILCELKSEKNRSLSINIDNENIQVNKTLRSIDYNVNKDKYNNLNIYEIIIELDLIDRVVIFTTIKI